MFNVAHMRLFEVPDGTYTLPQVMVFSHDITSLPTPCRSVSVDVDVDGQEYGMVLRTLYSAIVTQWGVITLDVLTWTTVDRVHDGIITGIYHHELGMRKVELSYKIMEGMENE